MKLQSKQLVHSCRTCWVSLPLMRRFISSFASSRGKFIMGHLLKHSPQTLHVSRSNGPKGSKLASFVTRLLSKSLKKSHFPSGFYTFLFSMSSPMGSTKYLSGSPARYLGASCRAILIIFSALSIFLCTGSSPMAF
jgi:hypothetical protein